MFCPAGSFSTTGAEGIESCLPCPSGQYSYDGTSCKALVIPALDSTIQREVTFRFLGINFDEFSKDVEKSQQFNQTTVNLVNDASAAVTVWLTTWSSGSVIAPFRMTYQDGTSVADMDADKNNLQTNAAQVFGDNLKKFGVTGIEVMGDNPAPPEGLNDDDDSNTLAIALGVGLGVGIPLIAGVIFYCIWSRRKQQVIAPGSTQAS